MKIGFRSIVTALLPFVLLLPSLQAMAAQDKQAAIKVNVGYQNYYDPRTWVPVHVVVSTVSRQPLQGVIVYTVSSRDRPFEGTYEWKIPAGVISAGGVQSSSLTIGLPGLFLKGGGELLWENNGRVVSQTHLPGIPISGSEIAGIISERPQSVQFLAGVSSDNGSTELVTALISPTSLPSSMTLLESLSYLYIDGAAASQLSTAQVKGINDWVRAGGILILGGIEPNAGQVGGFLKENPVIPSIVLDQPPTLLATYAGSAPLRTSESLLYGTLAKGAQLLVGTASNVLVAEKQMGRGKVVYTGFDASAPDFLSWSGYAQFWDTLLHELRSQVLKSTPNLFGNNGVWGLYQAAEQFPQIYSPPLWIWETVFGFYVFVVGPVLYFLLRRRRKNELAWMYLPAISFVIAAGIYLFGVIERPKGILTQSVGIVDLYDKQLAQITGVEALMSPQARSYSIQALPDAWAVPMSEQQSNPNQMQTTNFFSGQSGTISFNRVGAWGGKFILTTQLTQGFGDVHGVLYQQGNSLAGYVTNHSRMDFNDSAMVTNHQVIDLGPLKKGQSINISAIIDNLSLHGNVMAGLGAVLSSAGYGVGKSLFDNSAWFLKKNIPAGDVMFVAWSHNEPALLKSEGVTLPATPQWIVRELIPVTQIKG